MNPIQSPNTGVGKNLYFEQLGLSYFYFQSKEFPLEMPIKIAAKNKQQAWDKFVTQHFGALKPNKKDWKIT